MTLSGSSTWDVSSTGTVQIENGGSWLNSSSGTVTIGTFQVDNGGTYSLSGSAAIPGTTRILAANSTIDYAGADQSVVALAYGNLTLSGSGTKTFAVGTTSISGNFSVTVPPPGGTVSSYSKNNDANYQTASILGNISINTSTNNSNINYNGAGDQNILAIDYYDLTLSNAGTKYFGAGTVGIGGNLELKDLAVVDAVTYNDTVKYFGTNKTVRYGFVNKNLKIDGDGAVMAGSNISVTNSLVINTSGTLNMDGYVLNVNGLLINNGNFVSTNPAGAMSFYSKNSGDANLLNSWANSGYNGTTTTRLPGTVNNDVLFIGNNKTINLTTNVSNLGTVRVDSSGTIAQTGGTASTKDMQLKNGGTYNQSGGELSVIHDLKVPTGATFNATAGTVRFNGAPSVGAIYTGNVQLNNLIVEVSADYKLESGDEIKISGNYTNNNSSLDNDLGSLIFNGTSPQQISTASNPASTKTLCGNLTVSNPSVTLLSDIGIQTSLNIISGGHINKNGNEIYLNGVLYTGPTPVELVSFIASVKNNSVLLSGKLQLKLITMALKLNASSNNETFKICFVRGMVILILKTLYF